MSRIKKRMDRDTDTTVGVLFSPMSAPNKIYGAEITERFSWEIERDAKIAVKREEETFCEKVARELRRSNDMYGFGLPTDGKLKGVEV